MKICNCRNFFADLMLFESIECVIIFLSKISLSEIVFKLIYIYICNHFRPQGVGILHSAYFTKRTNAEQEANKLSNKGSLSETSV